jgi:hypothetical protein
MSELQRQGPRLYVRLGNERPLRATTLATLLDDLDLFYRSTTGDRGGLVVLDARSGSLLIILGSALGAMAAVNTVYKFAENLNKTVSAAKSGTLRVKARRSAEEKVVRSIADAVAEMDAPMQIGVISGTVEQPVLDVPVEDARKLHEGLVRARSEGEQLRALPPSPTIEPEAQLSPFAEIAQRVIDDRRSTSGHPSELEAVLRALVGALDSYALSNVIIQLRARGLYEAADLLQQIATNSKGQENEPPLRS